MLKHRQVTVHITHLSVFGFNRDPTVNLRHTGWKDWQLHLWHAFSYQPLATYATIFRLILISSTTRKSPARSGGLNFQCVFGKSFSDGHPWRQTREAPRRHIAFFILHIDVEPDVWIHPLDLLDDTADLDRLGGVELCCLRVMRNERRCGE